MRSSIFRVTLAIVACLIMFIPQASAAKPEACSFIGSWFGFNADGNAYWTSTATGQNSSNGTYRIQVPGLDVTLSGAFPAADKYLGGTGIWERASDHAFNFVVMFIAVDSDGNSTWVGKLTGTDTLSAGCDSFWIESRLEIYLPWQNPFAEDSFFAPVEFDPHVGYRMTLDSPTAD